MGQAISNIIRCLSGQSDEQKNPNKTNPRSLIYSPSSVSPIDVSIIYPSYPHIYVAPKTTQIPPSLSNPQSKHPRKENVQREVEKVTKGVSLVKERWIKHYSSRQKILIVGDGDFSFSNSLAVAFGSASNMVATSLDSASYLRTNYKEAMSNIQSLKSRGCVVMHGVDTTKMANHLSLNGIKFDRIVYNFPLAGFFPNKSRQSELRLHQKLVILFLGNAKKMISEKGEIHITHKTNGFFREWNLEGLALVRGLRLKEELKFNLTDYPGYHTKYGFGGDNNFNCNPSKTYKFGL